MSKLAKVKLGDLAAPGRSLISGPFGSDIGQRFFKDKGVPVIRGNNLTTNFKKFIDEGFVFVTDEKANELKADAIAGDILFTAAGTIGQVGQIPRNAKYSRYVISNKQIRFRVDNEKADPDFIFYWLASPWIFNAICNRNTGSTVPLINLGIIKSLPVLLPNRLDDQKDISRFLSTIDKKIEVNNRINAELEAMAKTLYDYWFVQFDFPDANGKPYKTAGGKMVYNPTLKREIPEGWVSTKLNQLLTNKPQSINVSQISKEIPYTPIDYLPSKKMSFGEYASSSEASTSLIKYSKGDILIGAMRVYFHRVCVAPFNGITRQTTMVLKPNNFSFLPFLYQICNEDRAINFANIISVGTQQPYVNWDNGFENYEIPFPNNINIIEKYCSSMESTVNSVVQRNLENNRLTELREWLLPMLMNGQVTVK